MGLSRRAPVATTRPPHHHYSTTTHNPHSHDDDDDDDDDNAPSLLNYRSSQSATTSRINSSLALGGGGMIKMVCVVILTATTAVHLYSSERHMSPSSYTSARSTRRRSVVANNQALFDDDSKHIIPRAHFSGNGTLVSTKRPREHVREASSATLTTASMIMTIPRRLIFTHKSNILEAASTEQTRRLSMQEVRFQQNVLNTIERYQLAWKAIDDASSTSNTTNGSREHSSNNANNNVVQVWFLDNDDCQAAIQHVEPELVQHFRDEARGDYKADLCRIAALYLHGGYYFDVDMRVITPIIFDENKEESNSTVTFSTAIMAARDGFFQSFLASTASNPILQESLQIMLDWYKNKAVLKGVTEETLLSQPISGTDTASDSMEERRNKVSNLQGIDPALLVIHRRGLIGPVSLKFAFERVMLNRSNSTSFDEGSTPVTTSGNQKAYILQEDDLSASPNQELFPDLVRQQGDGCCCNYLVHGPARSFTGGEQGLIPRNTSDATSTTPYFFSRIVGAGEYCHWKGGVGAWVRSQQQQKQSSTYELFKPF